jgi:predicted MFS family arabinose efflux permease
LACRRNRRSRGRQTESLLASAILFAFFVAAELIQQRPMVDFALFRKRTFLGACFAMLGFAASAQVMMTYLPLYLQNVFALSPAVAGLGMLPFALLLFVCPRIAASLANRISSRDLLALGLGILSAIWRQPPWSPLICLTVSWRLAC